jgi:hypothetical protein
MPKPLFDYEQLIATVGAPSPFDPPPKPKDSDGDGVPDQYDRKPYDDQVPNKRL